VTNSPSQLRGEVFQMIISFREQKRRSTSLHRLDDVVTDTAISRLVADQIAVKRLKFDSLVRGRRRCLLKRGGTNKDGMSKRTTKRLRPRTNAMPDRTALA
jgi:hypothetical protein